ncbi:OLC1v1033137C2 [Oldenlandia corymbosa var. corymbosa]|uniref:OLC1v1033137C2 n=1 Tax=Oldenlandia corymbosa var. corymbosa TaxID=529605 RepID=A0AAV1CNE4_OLDCO|nr:OLC1v1033137C2 [Oldenlandia corymbosa var. corymbosa]
MLIKFFSQSIPCRFCVFLIVNLLKLLGFPTAVFLTILILPSVKTGTMLLAGGAHSHSHDHDHEHSHVHDHSGDGPFQSHAHSLEDLSVGLSILAGIILFLIVEKLVRYVEDSSGGVNTWSRGHHHHHHKKGTKLEKENEADENLQLPQDDKQKDLTDSKEVFNGGSIDSSTSEEKLHPTLRKRNTGEEAAESKTGSVGAENGVLNNVSRNDELKPESKSSNLVFGYLNLFSDGVHNFTDGMALGNAFLLYGSIGGWSRTLFLLAHELPQEIGDFGILVRSGFSVSTALFFNFLSALVALAGTALALMWGQDPGHSSLIEGLTAGGFIYIAVAGVLAEMNNNGSSSFRSGAIQLVSLVAGMAVALGISLVE